MGFALLKRKFRTEVCFPSLRMMLKQREVSVAKKERTLLKKMLVRLISKVIQLVFLANILFRDSGEMFCSLSLFFR